jgi:putative tryptophan/tyrosine transport system substrate-binding protein
LPVGRLRDSRRLHRKYIASGCLAPVNPSLQTTLLAPRFSTCFAKYGYVPDRNLVLEIHGAETHPEQLPRLADDLVANKADVILTFSYPAAMAAKNATTTIPIVATETGGDPVATGLIKSLSRPTGNITGVSDMAIELSAKRLELLKDVVPTLRTVAMLWNASDLGMTLRYQGAADAARTLGVRVQPLGVREPEDFDEAFTIMEHDPPDAILMVSDALTGLNRRRVYEFAAEHRLPATYERGNYVREGVCRPTVRTWMKFTIARHI